MENTVNNKKQIEDLKTITENFGITTELCKLNEEVGELLGECYKAVYTDETMEVLNSIEDEFADVMVILSQIGIYFGLDMKRTNKIFDYKVERTVNRIKDGWYEKHR